MSSTTPSSSSSKSIWDGIFSVAKVLSELGEMRQAQQAVESPSSTSSSSSISSSDLPLLSSSSVAVQKEMNAFFDENLSIENLVFKGGGPKGLAYLGALKVLEGYYTSPLKSLKRVAGTSAGAITATLLAVGYSHDELEKILLKTDLKSFLDSDIIKKVQEFANLFQDLQGLIEMVKSTVTNASSNPKNMTELLLHLLATVEKFQKIYPQANSIVTNTRDNLKNAIRNPGTAWETVKDIATDLFNEGGLCKGEELYRWIEGLIKIKTGIPDCTFGELKKLIESGKPFKHLYVWATDIKSKKPIQIDTENKKWENVVISSAVRASMSIPFVFATHILRVKGKNLTVIPDPNLGTFIDGGLIRNCPVDAFDDKLYSANHYFNHKTLAFDLVEKSQPSQEEKCDSAPESIGNAFHVLEGILGVILNAEDHLRHERNDCRVIQIDTVGMGLISGFFASDEQKMEIIASGAKATKTFLDDRDKKHTNSK